eukprot:15331488-Ditylum_brightwellii.AAC.1
MGCLTLVDGSWKFIPYKEKQVIDLPNFALTYQSLLDQQLILPVWHSAFIPAAVAACELNGLIKLGTFHEISLDEYGWL